MRRRIFWEHILFEFNGINVQRLVVSSNGTSQNNGVRRFVVVTDYSHRADFVHLFFRGLLSIVNFINIVLLRFLLLVAVDAVAGRGRCWFGTGR